MAEATIGCLRHSLCPKSGVAGNTLLDLHLPASATPPLPAFRALREFRGTPPPSLEGLVGCHESRPVLLV